MLAQLTPEQFFDALAIRVDGPRCAEQTVSLDADLSDTGTRYRLTLRNGALTCTAAAQTAAAGVQVDGDIAALGRLPAALDETDPAFAIVTP